MYNKLWKPFKIWIWQQFKNILKCLDIEIIYVLVKKGTIKIPIYVLNI